MKLLLTSGGITNPSIRHALVDMLGKPIEDANAIDDETAFKVIDDTVEVVSEGHWRLFAPSASSPSNG